jgi:hypothetical protein
MKLPLTSSDNNAQLASLQRPYSAAPGNTVSTGSTVIATGGNIKSGQAAYDSGAGFWLGSDAGVPKFSIGDSSGDKMTWDGSALSVTGNLTATTGTIGGFTIGATTITGGNLTLDSSGHIRAGQTAFATGTGFWLGIDGGDGKFSLGKFPIVNSATDGNLSWDGSSLTLNGAVFADEDISVTSVAGDITLTQTLTGMSFILRQNGTGAQALITANTANDFSFAVANNAAGENAYIHVASGPDGLPYVMYGQGGNHYWRSVMDGADAHEYKIEYSTSGTGSWSTALEIATTGGITAGVGIAPDANDGAYLGTSTLGWSDLFLAEGGVINWDNGDATLTQAGNVVTLAGATLTADVNGTIGATTPAAGTFTTLSASTSASLVGASIGGASSKALHTQYTSADTDITGLISGSDSGALVEAPAQMHYVIGLRENDAGDSFAIISGGGNYSTDSIYDTLVAKFAANGGVTMNAGTVQIGTVDINGGAIDGAAIGAASAAAGKFTTLTASAGGSLAGTWTDLGTVTTVDINGGTIDGATIGGSSAGAGTFTDLTANGNTTLGSDAADTLTVNAESVSQPNIPAFLAYNSATDTNQTGAGATVTVDFDTEVFDQSGDFSADTFTAPATGKYSLGAQVVFTAIPAGATTVVVRIVTSNRTYTAGDVFVAGTFTQKTVFLSAIADMDSGDTASVTCTISGGAGDTASILGSASAVTYFSGIRVA